MKTSSKTLLSLCTIVFLAVAGQASANLVTNGDFETGDFTGWTTSGPGFAGVLPFPNSGAFAAGFASSVGDGGGFQFLSQDIATTAGATYDLSFFMTLFGKGGPGSAQGGPFGIGLGECQVFWGGVMIFDTTNPPFNYMQFNVPGLLASGASTELKFAFNSEFFAFLLDDVVINQVGGSSVPDNLSTLWLALPLIGMFGFAKLRRAES